MSTVTWFIPSAPVSEPTVTTELEDGKVDHVAAALSRLPEQFKRKPKIEALLTALVTPCISLEDALWQLLTERAVDTAIGVQLDQLGSIVGQERGGLDDDDYRRYIRARIMANRSRGTVEDLLRVARLVVDDEDVIFELESQHGAVIVRLRAFMAPDALAEIVLSFLEDAKAGGIRVILETVNWDEDDAFACPPTSWLMDLHPIGATFLEVYTGPHHYFELFPDFGEVVLDAGTATEETVAYTARGNISGSWRFVLSAPTTVAHADVSPISLTGGFQSGEGWGDSADAGQPNTTPYSDVGTVGGRMADARD